MYDTIIIGGGPAGLTAAIYCARYKMKTALIAERIGGMMTDAHLIENFPGFPAISGIELGEKLKEHVRRFEIEIIEEKVVDINKDRDSFQVTDKSNKKYSTKSLILAMGTEKRKLNVSGEERFLKRGVSYCYCCDAPFFKDKVVGVIGGSNSAAMATMMLSQYAKKVYVIYRKERIRADPMYVEAIEKNPKVTVINNADIARLNGKDFLESVDLTTGDSIKLDGLFIEIGAIPLLSLIKGLGIDIKDGFINVNRKQETNVKGIFSAGDITNGSNLKQIIVSAGQGAIAAASAYSYIMKVKC